MRLDAVSKPSIGAVALNFKLDKKCALATKIFLDHDNPQVALSMATGPAVTRTSVTNIVYLANSMQTMHTLFAMHQVLSPKLTYLCQPFTIFTLADHDREISPLSTLFRHMAAIVLRLEICATLAKAIVESCLWFRQHNLLWN